MCYRLVEKRWRPWEKIFTCHDEFIPTKIRIMQNHAILYENKSWNFKKRIERVLMLLNVGIGEDLSESHV